MNNRNTKYISLFEGFCRKNQIDGKEVTIHISGHPVKVKVAASNITKSQGYMNLDEPKGDTGILFIYDIEQIITLWMKNVNFKLDVIFFGSDMNEVNRLTMDEFKGERDDQLKIYKSLRPARYAVELPSGWCEKNLDDKSNLKF